MTLQVPKKYRVRKGGQQEVGGGDGVKEESPTRMGSNRSNRSNTIKPKAEEKQGLRLEVPKLKASPTIGISREWLEPKPTLKSSDHDPILGGYYSEETIIRKASSIY